MLKIGDFSKLSSLSIRMLRHYDEIGLLKPASIDPSTDYRHTVKISFQRRGASLRPVTWASALPTSGRCWNAMTIAPRSGRG